MAPLVAIAVVLGLWWFTRTRDLFTLSVRKGRVTVVRGRVPPGLFAEFKDVLSRPPVERATVRVYLDEDGGALRTRGLDPGREQRLRNIFALFPASRLRNAPAIRQPTLGQLVGIAWLARLLDRD